MADNVAITPGAGASVATDDIAGVQYQRVKVTWGVDGAAADASATDPLPVTVSNGVAGLQDNGSSNFTLGTTQGVGMMAYVDDVSPSAATEARAGIVRMTADRQLRTAMVPATGYVNAAGTDAQVKYAVISAGSSGDNSLVAAVASKKIRVLSAHISFAGSTNAKWRSGTTDLTGLTYGVVNAGMVLPYNPNGHFETASNTALNLNLSAAVVVGGSLTYAEI